MDCFKNPETYSAILNDTDAQFNYFSIQYLKTNGDIVIIPIGVYGLSKKHAVRFPLLLNDFWRDFLMIKLQEFSFLCGIAYEQELHYNKLLSLRKSFIEKIFRYYFNLDDSAFSAMAWDIRGEKSLTRKLALEIGYARMEFLKSEMYSSLNIQQQQWNYLKECLIKWFDIFNNIVQTPTREIHPNLPLIAKGFINFKSPQKNLI